MNGEQEKIDRYIVALCQFLGRTQLKGEEVATFTECAQWLQSLHSSSPQSTHEEKKE